MEPKEIRNKSISHVNPTIQQRIGVSSSGQANKEKPPQLLPTPLRISRSARKSLTWPGSWAQKKQYRADICYISITDISDLPSTTQWTEQTYMYSICLRRVISTCRTLPVLPGTNPSNQRNAALALARVRFLTQRTDENESGSWPPCALLVLCCVNQCMDHV